VAPVFGWIGVFSVTPFAVRFNTTPVIVPAAVTVTVTAGGPPRWG
jgi:hypothetical protein